MSTNDQASSARVRVTGAANTSQNKARKVFLPFVMMQLWPKIYQSLRIVSLENIQAVLPTWWQGHQHNHHDSQSWKMQTCRRLFVLYFPN
jgi:hypothetical protein